MPSMGPMTHEAVLSNSTHSLSMKKGEAQQRPSSTNCCTASGLDADTCTGTLSRVVTCRGADHERRLAASASRAIKPVLLDCYQ